jgi:signal transduction histidine kinase
LRLTLLGGVALDITNANPFEVQPKLPSDVVCFIPPFAYMQKGTPASCFIGKEKVEVPRSSGEVWFLLNALRQTSKTGRIGVVVPINFLFNHSLRKVRRALLEEDYLDAVIELPDKCFFPSMSIKTVLLVLNKMKSQERKHTVALGVVPDLNKNGDLTPTDLEAIVAGYRSNAPSDNWVFATIEEIQGRDYNLTPSSYHNEQLDALHHDNNGKQLDEICQVIRGKVRKPIESDTGLPFISTKDLSGEVTDPYIDFSQPTLCKPEVSNQLITQKCILVSLIGRDHKATIYDPERAFKSQENEDTKFEGILINHNIACIVPNTELVDFEYLYFQLYTPLFMKQFENLHRGVGIPNISILELCSIIIPVLERKVQQRDITGQIKEALLKKANANLLVLKTKLNIEEEKQDAEFQIVRHLAHDLSPKLSTVDSILKHLTRFIASHELLQEPLQEQFYEGQRLEPVGEAIDKARSDISQMHKLIKDTRKVITEEIPLEEFSSVNLREFLEATKKKYANGAITLEIDCGHDIQYEIHATSFAEMIDNFVRNAEIHGFVNGGKGEECKIVIVVTKQKNDPNLIVEIKNNGNPLPDELTVEKFINFGSKGKNSSGDGLGGAYIYKVIRAHRGNLEIIRDDKEYLVNFKITLPNLEGNK